MSAVFVFIGLFLLGFSLQVGAETSDSQTSRLTFDVAEAVLVDSWPAAVLTFAADIVPEEGAVIGPLTLSVKSNSTWSVLVRCDQADGYLREADASTGSYISDGAVSAAPLQVSSSAGGPWLPLSANDTPVYSSQAPTGEAGAQVDLYFRYVPTFDDRPLADGSVYKTIITYTVTVSY